MIEEDFTLKISSTLEKAKKYLNSKYQINKYDLDDILQNAALKAFKNLKSFREKCSFETWFIAIAKNETRSFLLNQQKSRIINCSDDILKSYSLEWVNPESVKNEEQEEKSNFLKKSIHTLSKNHKSVINLLIKEHSPKEISKILNIPVSSVRTRIFYAKKSLKKFIINHE